MLLRHWNSRLIHKVPLNPFSVTCWCCVYRRKMMAHIFQKIASVTLLLWRWALQNRDQRLLAAANSWIVLGKNVVPAGRYNLHTCHNGHAEASLHGRFITRFGGLIIPYFFLWSFLKSCIYKNKWTIYSYRVLNIVMENAVKRLFICKVRKSSEDFAPFFKNLNLQILFQNHYNWNHSNTEKKN